MAHVACSHGEDTRRSNDPDNFFDNCIPTPTLTAIVPGAGTRGILDAESRLICKDFGPRVRELGWRSTVDITYRLLSGTLFSLAI